MEWSIIYHGVYGIMELYHDIQISTAKRYGISRRFLFPVIDTGFQLWEIIPRISGLKPASHIPEA